MHSETQYRDIFPKMKEELNLQRKFSIVYQWEETALNKQDIAWLLLIFKGK